LVELWKVTTVWSAVLAVNVEEIDGGLDLSFRMKTSTAEVKETNENNDYESYYAADHAADDCACI